jgi:hypothetical protein
MDVKKRILALPLAVALAVTPACPALAGSSKGGKSARGKQPQASAHSAGRKVH